MFRLIISVFLAFINICVAQNIHKTDSLIKIISQEKLSKRDQAVILESISFYHPELDHALEYAYESLKVASEIKDIKLQALAWEGIGLIENRLGNTERALEATYKALNIYQSHGLIEKQAATYAQIANYLILDKDYMQAIQYLQKAYTIYFKQEDNWKKALTLINLGEVYRLSEDCVSSKVALKEALELNKIFNNNTIYAYATGNLGMVYAIEGQHEKAKLSLEVATEILSKMEDWYSASIYKAELGKINSNKNKIEQAEESFLSAYKIAKRVNLKEQIRDFSGLLSSHYEERKLFDKALKFQKIFQTYQDSLVNKENVKKIEQIKAGYIINKKELEIERLQIVSTNRRNTVFGLVVGILLLIIFFYLLYSSYKKVNKYNTYLAEQKAIISQREQEKTLLLKELNHRVKNNLHMISSLLNLQSRDVAEESNKQMLLTGKNRVEALSLVHQKLYQEGVETKIDLKEYVEGLVVNLIKGYNKQIKYVFRLTPLSIDVNDAIPIALIINELVTNSIKHAYYGVDNPFLTIRIAEKKGVIKMEIIDNGSGYVYKKEDKKKSFGLKLITSLIEQIGGSIKTLNNEGTHWVVISKINLEPKIA